MAPEEVRAWALELLCAPRSTEAYERLVAQVALIVEQDYPECDLRHTGDSNLDHADRVVVVSAAVGPPCSSVEASEYVTVLLNGAGTAVGASVSGSPTAWGED